MALCQPWARRAKAPAWEAHSIKSPECQRVLLLETKQTQTSVMEVSKNADSMFSISLDLYGREQ